MGPDGNGELMQGTQALGVAATQGGTTRWRLALVWFLRLLSIAWMTKGLLAWAVIFGIGNEAQPPFEARLLSYQSIIVYFAVIDLVAAVGLWLTSTWGGVLWLLAALSHLLLGFVFPRLLPMSMPMIAGYVALMLTYFLATWLAENENS